MSDLYALPILSFRRTGGRDERNYGRRPAYRPGFMPPRLSLREIDPVSWLTALLLAAAFLLGGASQDDAWRPAVIEVLSLVVIGLALPRLQMNGELKSLRPPLALAGLFLMLPLIQLIPLPLDVWARLPGHADLAAALRRFGLAPGWLPLSLTPARTLDSFLWLLIPIGVFTGVAACSDRQRRALLPIVVAAGIVSMLIGYLQLTRFGGALRLYDITNPERPVGLFANRNHAALFILLGLPLAAAWLRLRRRRRESPQTLLNFAVLGALAAFAVVAVVVSHSRAGLGLALPAIAGAALLLLWRGELKRRWVVAVGLVVVAGVGAVGAVLTRSAWFAHRLAQTGEDYRGTIWSGAVSLAERFSPTGAGMGSFAQVYPAVEHTETLQAAFVNHAHNDYLEVWVCAGYAGVALTALFMAWLAWRTLDAWRSKGAVLAQAGSVVVALVAAHSLVDYPVRTPAIAAVVAFGCALLALPRSSHA